MKSITVLSMLVLALTMISCGVNVPNALNPLANPPSPFPPTTPRDWVQLGTSFPTTYATERPKIKHNPNGSESGIYILYKNSTKSLTMMRWDSVNSVWIQVGTNFLSNDIAGNQYPDMAFDNAGTPYVFSDAGSSKVGMCVKYTGGYWQQVGVSDITGGSQPQYLRFSWITELNEPYVSFSSANDANKVRVMRYTAGAWTAVGGFLTTGMGTPSRVHLDSLTSSVKLAVTDNSRQTIYYMRYVGGIWTQTGGAITNLIGTTTNMDYCHDIVFITNVPYVTFAMVSPLTSYREVRVKRYNGTSWEDVGPFIQNTGTGTPAEAGMLNIEYVFPCIYLYNTSKFSTSGYGDCQITRLTNGAWETFGTLGAPSSSIGYMSLIGVQPMFIYKNGALNELIVKRY